MPSETSVLPTPETLPPLASAPPYLETVPRHYLFSSTDLLPL